MAADYHKNMRILLRSRILHQDSRFLLRFQAICAGYQ